MTCAAGNAGRAALVPLALGGDSLRGEAKSATRNDIPHSTEVGTPHVPWATKLPGGPIRGFFVPSVTEGRDMVELMQRLSLEPTTVTIDRSWDLNCWGVGDFYDGDHVLRGDKDDFRIVYGYVEEDLLSAKPFEVLVIPGQNGWHVHGPDGAFRPEYAKVTHGDGSAATFTRPLALNDAVGEYRVRVTDVVGVASAEARLRVE